MNQLLLEKSGDTAHLALLDDGRLIDYQEVLLDENKVQIGDIYHAKVIRVVKGLSACFVRLRDKEDAFMQMQRPLRPGDSLLVQVKRAAFDKKQAMVSEDIEIAGNYAVLFLGKQGVSLAKSLKDSAFSKQLSFFSLPGAHVMLRSRCSGVRAEVIRNEIDHMAERLQKSEMEKAPAPSLYLKGEGEISRILSEIKEEISLVKCNIQGFSHAGANVVYMQSPFADSDVKKQLGIALRRKIQLSSGVDIIIDPTEALTVIDINSAKGNTKHDAAFSVNLLAVKEIARILRLRGTGGIVLIDCIDMQDKQKRAQVLSALQEALQTDRVKTTVHGFTKLGLIEITRQRKEERKDAENMRCPLCHGSGIRPLEGIWKEEN